MSFASGHMCSFIFLHLHAKNQPQTRKSNFGPKWGVAHAHAHFQPQGRLMMPIFSPREVNCAHVLGKKTQAADDFHFFTVPFLFF